MNLAGRQLSGSPGRRFQVTFREADAEHLLYKADMFDLVVEHHVLWTLTKPAVALAEWSRVLRPGGRLVLIEGDWRGSGHADYAPLREHLPLLGGRPASDLADILTKAGFLEVEREPLMDAVLWVLSRIGSGTRCSVGRRLDEAGLVLV